MNPVVLRSGWVLIDWRKWLSIEVASRQSAVPRRPARNASAFKRSSLRKRFLPRCLLPASGRLFAGSHEKFVLTSAAAKMPAKLPVRLTPATTEAHASARMARAFGRREASPASIPVPQVCATLPRVFRADLPSQLYQAETSASV